jgi:hypothetical protein
MSLSSIIRAAAGGPKTNRAEGGEPDENLEDDIPAEDDETAEGDEPGKDGAQDDEPEDEASDGDKPEDEAQDDETDEEMSASGKAAHAKGRKAERARIAAIMGDPAADSNPRLAAHLAFSTSMEPRSAVAALNAGGTPAETSRLAGKMAQANQPRLGGGAAAPSGTASQPQRIAAAAAAITEAKRARTNT